MTCIVGLIDDDRRVWIGGDSAAVGGLSLNVRTDPKVFVKDGFVMGFTTSFRMGQLLAHSFTPPKRHPDTDLFAYMVTAFVDGLRSCLKDGGYAERRNEAETGGTFLVGHAGRLFCIYDDYQVAEWADGYAAVGCGADITLGALFATAGSAPDARVCRALEAAERFSAGVRGPFITHHAPPPPSVG